MDEFQNGQIRDLLVRKLDLYKTLLSYAEKQQNISYTDMTTVYSGIMEQRAGCIERIKKTDGAIQHCLSGNVEPKTGFSGEVTDYDNQIKEIIRQIIALDDQNKKRLLTEQQTLKEKLRAIKEGKKGRNGYQMAGKVNMGGAFMDSRG